MTEVMDILYHSHKCGMVMGGGVCVCVCVGMGGGVLMHKDFIVWNLHPHPHLHHIWLFLSKIKFHNMESILHLVIYENLIRW